MGANNIDFLNIQRCEQTEGENGGVVEKCYSVDKEKELLKLIALGVNIQDLQITFKVKGP